MRSILSYLVCFSVALGCTWSVKAQPSVPLPNGQKLELKRRPPPEMAPFPEIKLPEKTGVRTPGGEASAGINEKVIDVPGPRFAFDVASTFLSDKTILVSGGTYLHAVDAVTGNVKFKVENVVPGLSRFPVGVSPDEKSFWAVEEEGKQNFIRQRDTVTGKLLHETKMAKEDFVWDLILTGRGKTALASLLTKVPGVPLRLIDPANGRTIREITPNFGLKNPLEQPLCGTATSPLVATSVLSPPMEVKIRLLKIRLYNGETGQLQREIDVAPDDQKLSSITGALSQDGRLLALSLREPNDGTGKIQIFDTQNGVQKTSFTVKHKKALRTAVAFSPQRDKLAIASATNIGVFGDDGSGAGIVALHDVATGKEIKAWNLPKMVTASVVFSPDGAVLAATGTRVVDGKSKVTGVIQLLRLSDSGGGIAKVKPGGPTPEALAELQRLNAQFAARIADSKNAIVHYQKLLQDNPNNADLHLGLGQALAGQNQFTEAAAVLQKAVDGDPKNPAARQALAQVLTNHATDLAQKEKWDEAAQQARRALALQPKTAHPHAVFARSLFHQGQIEEGARQMQQAHAKGHQDAALAGKLAERLAELAQQASAKNEHAKAVEQLRLAVEIEQQKASHHARLGNALLAANRLRDAIEPLENATRLDTTKLEYRRDYATGLMRLGRYRDAEPILRSILLIAPDDKQASAALAECVLRQGRLAEASQLAQQALKGGLPQTDLPPVLRSFLEAEKGGKTFQLPGLPSVVGLPVADARKALEATGAKVVYQVGAAAPSTGKVNAVYAMDPEPTAPIDKDTVVTITLYGPLANITLNQVLMPDLSGLSAKAASEMLQKEGLKGKFQLGKAAPTKAKALTVAKSDPGAGEQVAKGNEVTVTLYGPAEETADGKIAVPSLVGLSAPKAKQALEEVGLKGSFQLGKPAPDKARSLTVSQSDPAAGERVAKGVEVKVTLFALHDGKNPDPPEPKDAVTVPDCVTLSLDEATAKLKAAGFKVTSKVGRPATFAGQIERVYHMEPAPGARVQRGETIHLLIYGSRKEQP